VIEPFIKDALRQGGRAWRHIIKEERGAKRSREREDSAPGP